MVYPYKRKAQQRDSDAKRRKYETAIARRAPSGGAYAYRDMNRSTRGFLGMELKFIDLAISATNLGTTIAGSEIDPPSTFTCLNGIGQGDGQSERDGRKYVMKSVMVKGTVDLPGADNVNNGDTNVFVALVLDKQTNGAQLSAEDVFVIPTTSNPGSVDGFVSQPFRNLENVQRFDVLASECIVVQNNGMAYNGTTLIPLSARKTFEFYKKLEVPVMCTGTGSSVASISDNSLHMVAWCDNAGAVPQIVYNSRVRFVG